MPLSPFRQKWLQMFPGFHKSPHPPPLPPFPSKRVQCDMNSSKFSRATSQIQQWTWAKENTADYLSHVYILSVMIFLLCLISNPHVNVLYVCKCGKKLVVIYQSEVQWLWRTIAFLTTMLFPTLYEMVWMFTASLLGMLGVAKFAIPR